jgi:hypothetical protein
MSYTLVALIAALSFVITTSPVEGAKASPVLMQYEVITIDPGSWVVTARETATGDTVKFKMPPTVFHGKTFDANLAGLKKGRRFSIRGQRNARLNQLTLKKPPVPRRFVRKAKKNRPQRVVPVGRALPWKILNVNSRNWVVTAKNTRTGKVAKFKVDPTAFRGFRFRADIRSIKRGRGFSIVTPNNAPMPNACTLIELQK